MGSRDLKDVLRGLSGGGRAGGLPGGGDQPPDVRVQTGVAPAWSPSGPPASVGPGRWLASVPGGPVPGEGLRCGGPWATLQMSFVWPSLC